MKKVEVAELVNVERDTLIVTVCLLATLAAAPSGQLFTLSSLAHEGLGVSVSEENVYLKPQCHPISMLQIKVGSGMRIHYQ